MVLGGVSLSASAAKPVSKVAGVAEPIPAFPNLRFERPVGLYAPPDGTDRLFVLEQAGKIYAFPNRRDVTREEVTLALDLTVRRKENEEGLLGLAFHPDFHENGELFLHYSTGQNPARPNRGSQGRRGVVARFTTDADRTVIDPNSEKRVLEIPQPYGNHNGGQLAFGEDNLLYIGLGDGGAAGDPENHAQNVTNLLGAILRIDIDPADPAQPYAIPPDNPFADPDRHPGARPEIYAYGLRNPWRFSFDRTDRGGLGHLWVADVGQETHEEINLVGKGGNYGWRIREGRAPYKPNERPDPPVELQSPLVDLLRRDAGSITGGFVYHGRKNPLLEGAYIYADYLTGKVFLLRQESGRVREHQHFARVKTPTSFGLDRRGEIYICSFDGRIYTLIPPRRR